ncbi:class I SAM-dependent methyltransferase [Actinomadura sp. KC216]|uniref:class I SAM-dependent methyltransferase n=1 Tax=Actinomadura sp. KC216 TaxID=2530370 RepID=UPI0014047B9D|nr:class I SAM-dependent methyltransferase [Actinomadura sp. KC216]
MIPDIGSKNRIPGDDLRRQVEELRLKRPEIYGRIDPRRVDHCLGEPAPERDDFAAETDGGRGPSYVRAQSLNIEARLHGIERLLNLVRRPSGRQTVLDLLGGDGLLSRVSELLGISDAEIITCDASPHMVEAAWASGVPALLQRAEHLLFRSESVDAVLLAYGTHHIDPADRLRVAEEAYRVLRPGGTFVLHDFPVGSPVDQWFGEVVDRYSPTGHRYAHFTHDEIRDYLVTAGFESVEVNEIDDPYLATGGTPDEAELRLGEYLVDMYGLHDTPEPLAPPEKFRWAAELAKAIFRYPNGDGTSLECITEYVDHSSTWRIMVPRRALVGIGRKSTHQR